MFAAEIFPSLAGVFKTSSEFQQESLIDCDVSRVTFHNATKKQTKAAKSEIKIRSTNYSSV